MVQLETKDYFVIGVIAATIPVTAVVHAAPIGIAAGHYALDLDPVAIIGATGDFDIFVEESSLAYYIVEEV